MPPGVRLAFILGHSLLTAMLLRTTETAVVKFIQARRPLEDYLGPHCGHLTARKSCNPVQGPRKFLPVREKPFLWTLDLP